MKSLALPAVAIIGRPNVGKSTLFNRLVGRRLAVVDDLPGITRDRLAARSEWNGREFHVVDTGGWVPEADETMDGAILAQVMHALEACDLVVFLVDARAGLHPHDRVIAHELFKLRVPCVLAANKADHEGVDADAAEFTSLGFERVFPISAQEGRGTGDLLDELLRKIDEDHATQVRETSERRRTSLGAEEGIRVAVVGRPNVGKSSLVNCLLGEDRMIVDNRPGTTRDAVDSPLRYHGEDLVLVDTAGIRRRLGSQPQFEFYATLRAMRAIDRSDVAVLVLDATEPVLRQDTRIGGMIDEASRAAVIAVNKWDLLEKDDGTLGEWVKKLDHAMPFLHYAPKIFISALTSQRIHRLPEAVVRVYKEGQRQIPTAEWNAVLEKAIEHNPPRSRGGGARPAKIYYATQVKSAPVTVALFVSDPKRLSSDYTRYLVGRFRQAFGFEGNPIRLVLRKS